jgi:hypothetical protein
MVTTLVVRTRSALFCSLTTTLHHHHHHSPPFTTNFHLTTTHYKQGQEEGAGRSMWRANRAGLSDSDSENEWKAGL